MKSILSLSDIQRRQLFEGAAQRAGIQEIILLEKDYKDMREMFFGEPLSWDRIISRLRELERQINGTE